MDHRPQQLEDASPPQYRFWGSQRPPEDFRPLQVATTPAPSGSQAAQEDPVAPTSATMRLYGPIDSWGGFWGVSASEFTAALDEVGAVRELHLRINSPGGEVYEAIAIANALREHPARVVAHVDGLAASAASFIAAAADELVMGRNAELMIHDAWGISIGNAADMRGVADRLDAISDNIASIYSAKAGGDAASWRELMLAETWLSDGEAVASGLADRIAGDEPQGDEAAKNRFDLSAFRARGRTAARAPQLPVPRQESSPGFNTCCATDTCCSPDCNGTFCCHGDPGGCVGDCCAAKDSYAARHARRRHDMAAARHGLA